MTSISLSFDRDGAEHLVSALSHSDIQSIDAAIAGLPANRPGIRLVGKTNSIKLVGRKSRLGQIAAEKLGRSAVAVRMILFDKSEDNNWALGWHQDRTIAVQNRIDTPGFTAWTVKSGILHVSPPIEILSKMITLRAHLDDVGEDNAPLLIAPGTHKLGLIPEERINESIARGRIFCCHARRGDVWAYSTPILHASERARLPTRRRVLQVDYAGSDLPGALQWLGV